MKPHYLAGVYPFSGGGGQIMKGTVMTTTRVSVLLAAVFALGSATAAQSADLYGGGMNNSYYPGSIKDAVAAPIGPSWYLRIDGGYSAFDTPDITEDGLWTLTRTDIDDTWSLGGGIGRYFTSTIRGDITYEHRFEADAEGILADPGNQLPGTRFFGIESDVVLANVYYDFARHSRINPYVGIGLGVTYNKTTEGTVVDCGCTVGRIAEGNTTHVAGALMAGFTAKLRGGHGDVHAASFGRIKDAPIEIERGLYLDVGYRFLYLGEAETGAVTAINGGPVSRDPTVESLHAHEIRVGLRYEIF